MVLRTLLPGCAHSPPREPISPSCLHPRQPISASPLHLLLCRVLFALLAVPLFLCALLLGLFVACPCSVHVEPRTIQRSQIGRKIRKQPESKSLRAQV